MTRSATTLLLLVLAACASAPARAPLAIRDDLLHEFRGRASPDEVRQFDTLRSSPRDDDRDRALEMLLFGLSDERLFALGITSVDQPGRKDWSIAWTEDVGPGAEAVHRVLDREHIPGGGFCDLGFCGWYVQREEFFRARRALASDPEVRRLGVRVVEPRVTPEQSNR